MLQLKKLKKTTWNFENLVSVYHYNLRTPCTTRASTDNDQVFLATKELSRIRKRLTEPKQYKSGTLCICQISGSGFFYTVVKPFGWLTLNVRLCRRAWCYEKEQ